MHLHCLCVAQYVHYKPLNYPPSCGLSYSLFLAIPSRMSMCLSTCGPSIQTSQTPQKLLGVLPPPHVFLQMLMVVYAFQFASTTKTHKAERDKCRANARWLPLSFNGVPFCQLRRRQLITAKGRWQVAARLRSDRRCVCGCACVCVLAHLFSRVSSVD